MGVGIFLARENEWYKAAHYDASSASYRDYPAGSNTIISCSPPTATPNRANCEQAADNNLTIVGSYTGSASPYGTFDQGGNVWEWNENLDFGPSSGFRVMRGAGWFNAAGDLAAGSRSRACSPCSASPAGAGAAREPLISGAR